ncbi:MAG TPA: acyltransferase family protein [Symbiobacteriaceae bacterium]|nr:acyltransferase family protein [Symbiobacteriaceae bacterium]
MDRTARNHALDWLRVGGTVAVLLFHSARFFDAGDWHVKNPVFDPNLDIFATILIQWLMPLFFVLSGAGAWLALQHQTPGRFAAAKVPRLLVPLVFGILVLSPPQVYLERLTHHQFAGNLFEWLPHYFEGFYAFGGNFAWMGMHLWYLLVLLLWTYITMPLCLWLMKGAGQKLAGFLARPGMLFLLALPVALVELALKPGTLLAMQSMGGWSPLLYVIFYLFGFLLPAHEEMPKAFARHWWVGLSVGIIIPVAVLATGLMDTNAAYLSPLNILLTLLRAVNAVAWLIGLIGIGYRFCTRKTRFLDLAGEAVLPFYMLHQAVLLVLGYFVMQWPWANLAKFGFVFLATAAINILIYVSLIRPFRIGRFLFGMKPPRPSRSAAVPGPGRRLGAG